MRIIVLVHPELIPPENIFSYEKEIKNSLFKTEYDVVHGLRKLGHTVKVVALDKSKKPLKKVIREFKPHVAFNLLEEFKGEARLDYKIVEALQDMELNFTGNDCGGLKIARDKYQAKKILHSHGVLTPKFFRITKKNSLTIVPPNMQFPFIVKLSTEDASLGLSDANIVYSVEELGKSVKQLKKEFDEDILVEEFIEGRDIYVSILGNKQLTVLPPLELFFKKIPSGSHGIASSDVKWNLSLRKKYGIKNRLLKETSSEIESITGLSKIIYRLLGLSGYGRIDFRQSVDGRLFFLEANPNPDIGKGEEFSQSAEIIGIDYEQLLSKLLKLAKNKKTLKAG